MVTSILSYIDGMLDSKHYNEAIQCGQGRVCVTVIFSLGGRPAPLVSMTLEPNKR